MVWLQRIEDGSLSDEMSRQAEALALAINRSQLDVLCIAVNASLVADSASLIQVSAPPRGTRRYFEVQSAAERLRRAFNE